MHKHAKYAESPLTALTELHFSSVPVLAKELQLAEEATPLPGTQLGGVVT